MEFIIPLQGPGQCHFGPMICRRLIAECCLCWHSIIQAVDVHLRSTRFQGAFDALDVEALVQRLQKEFCLCCCPRRICRHNNATKGLQELSKSEELLLHTHKASVNSPDHTCISIFEKHQGIFLPMASPHRPYPLSQQGSCSQQQTGPLRVHRTLDT